jgi:hypothetical protein
LRWLCLPNHKQSQRSYVHWQEIGQVCQDHLQNGQAKEWYKEEEKDPIKD